MWSIDLPQLPPLRLLLLLLLLPPPPSLPLRHSFLHSRNYCCCYYYSVCVRACVINNKNREIEKKKGKQSILLSLFLLLLLIRGSAQLRRCNYFHATHEHTHRHRHTLRSVIEVLFGSFFLYLGDRDEERVTLLAVWQRHCAAAAERRWHRVA